jgi:hypothetical protein
MLSSRASRHPSTGGSSTLYTQPDCDPAVEGDISWWDEHLAYLFPDETDRNYLLNWLAWLVQNISSRSRNMRCCLQGPKQGTGKSFIVEVLSEISCIRRNVKNVNRSRTCTVRSTAGLSGRN